MSFSINLRDIGHNIVLLTPVRNKKTVRTGDLTHYSSVFNIISGYSKLIYIICEFILDRH